MNGPKLLTAEVMVDGQTFTGSGPSRAIAKNIAAEAAVHFVVMCLCVFSSVHDVQ